jgi:DHA1 family tetracycline resistance protein-like MFS transporter
MNRAVIFLFATVVLDAIGVGLMVPVVPELIQQLGDLSISEAAVYGGTMTALFAGVQFFASPILGTLADALGRRPVLMLSLTAFGLNYLLMGFAPNLTWLFIGQALAGLFGATPTTATAYIADIVAPEQRAKYFGMLGGAFSLGFMFGPVLSGMLSVYGVRVPFFVASALVLINVAYGYFVLPESLSKEKRRPFSMRSANIVGSIQRFKPHGFVIPLLVAALLIQFALQTIIVIWPYFTSYTLDWGAKEVGLSLGFYGVMGIINQGVLLGRVVRWLGEIKTILLALVVLVIGLTGYALANHWVWIILFSIPASMGFLSIGALSGYLSRHLAVDEQGAIQGLINSVNSFAAIITPLTIPWLFKITTNGTNNDLPGAVFFVGIFFSFIAFVVVKRFNRRHNR